MQVSKPFVTWLTGSPVTVMRTIFVLFVTLCTVLILFVFTFHPSPTPLRYFLRSRILESNMKFNLDLSIYEVFQLFKLLFGLITFIYLICFETFSVRYITFDTDLSILKKRNFTNPSVIWAWLLLILPGLLFSDCSYETNLAWIIHVCPNFTFVLW